MLVAYKGIEAEDGPLVEAFAQGDTEVGAEREVACLVFGAVTWEVGVRVVAFTLGVGTIVVHHVLQFDTVEDAADGHKDLFGCGGVDDIILIESEVVVVLQEDDVVLLPVPCAVEHGGYVVGGIVLGHVLRIGDIAHVFYSSVFSVLHEVVLVVEMEAVLVVDV